jgi:drug/metabolite transporter (DMT)-like permease
MSANTRKGFLLGLAATAIWGSVVMVPLLVPEFSPLQISVGRYLLYGLVSLVWLLPRRRRILPRTTPQVWLVLGWLSLLGNVLFYTLLTTAVTRVGAAMTALIVGLTPVSISLAGYLKERNLPLRRLAPALVLGCLGILCTTAPALFGQELSFGADQWLGLLGALGALVSWSAYAVANNTWLGRFKQFSDSEWSLLLGFVTGVEALLLLPFALDEQGRALDAWLRFALGCGWNAVFASLVCNALWNRMSRLLPLTLSGQMILFETLFALIYCFIWEARWPGPSELLAAVLLGISVGRCVAVHR